MPAVLSRIRGLKYPVSPDEPLRKMDSANGSGRMTWVVVPTGDHTLTIEDSQNAIAMTEGQVIVPNDSTVAFENGTSVLVLAQGAGAVTFAGAPGVVVRRRMVFVAKLAGQNALATLVKYSANDWILSGDLEVVP